MPRSLCLGQYQDELGKAAPAVVNMAHIRMLAGTQFCRSTAWLAVGRVIGP
jgi:hypothetical protein